MQCLKALQLRYLWKKLIYHGLTLANFFEAQSSIEAASPLVDVDRQDSTLIVFFPELSGFLHMKDLYFISFMRMGLRSHEFLGGLLSMDIDSSSRLANSSIYAVGQQMPSI